VPLVKLKEKEMFARNAQAQLLQEDSPIAQHALILLQTKNLLAQLVQATISSHPPPKLLVSNAPMAAMEEIVQMEPLLRLLHLPIALVV